MGKTIKIIDFGFRDGLFFIGYDNGALCWMDKDDVILMFLDWCTYNGIEHNDLTANDFDDFVKECNDHFLLISVLYP